MGTLSTNEQKNFPPQIVSSPEIAATPDETEPGRGLDEEQQKFTPQDEGMKVPGDKGSIAGQENEYQDQDEETDPDQADEISPCPKLENPLDGPYMGPEGEPVIDL